MTAQQPPFDIEPHPTKRSFSGRDVLRVVFKRKGIILGSFVIVSAVMIQGALRQPDLYAATARVLVRTGPQTTPPFLSGIVAYREDVASDLPSRRLETEMALIVAQGNVERVIARYGLRPEMLRQSAWRLAVQPFSAAAAQIRATFGRPATPVQNAADRMAETVAAFNRSLTTRPVQTKGAEVTSNIIAVTLTGTDRALTEAALESLVEEYVERSLANEREIGQQAMAALSGQAAQAMTELKQAEDAAANFVRSGASAPGADGAQGVAAERLRSEWREAQARLDALRETHGESDETVRAQRATANQLRNRLLLEMRQSAASGISLSVLERKRQVAQDRYVDLQRRLDQLALYQKLAPAELASRMVTDMPRAAEGEANIARPLMLFGGPALGLLLGLLLAALFESMDRRLQTREAVVRHIGLDVLGSLPNSKGGAFGRGRSGGRSTPPVHSYIDSFV